MWFQFVICLINNANFLTDFLCTPHTNTCLGVATMPTPNTNTNCPLCTRTNARTHAVLLPTQAERTAWTLLTCRGRLTQPLYAASAVSFLSSAAADTQMLRTRSQPAKKKKKGCKQSRDRLTDGSIVNGLCSLGRSCNLWHCLPAYSRVKGCWGFESQELVCSQANATLALLLPWQLKRLRGQR